MLDSTSIIDYTYEDFLVGINKIVVDIQASDFQPDYIVGVVRGGAIPSVYLSHRLKIPVIMVHWSTRDHIDISNESNCWIPEDVNNGKRVLLFDDIVDGGETIKEVLEDWQKSIYNPLNMSNIRVGSLIYNTKQPIKVDYFDFSIDRDEDARWVVFPWES